MMLGQSGALLAADGNGNGQVDPGDYDVWTAHLGQTVGSGSSSSSASAARAAVPEPASAVLAAVAAMAAIFVGWRRW